MIRRIRRWLSKEIHFPRWLCASLGHFEDLLEPRCDLCDAWLAEYQEPEYDLWDLRYDPPELLVTNTVGTAVDRWVPGAVYS